MCSAFVLCRQKMMAVGPCVPMCLCVCVWSCVCDRGYVCVSQRIIPVNTGGMVEYTWLSLELTLFLKHWIKKIILSIFGCAESSLLGGPFSSCGEQVTFESWCTGFSLQWLLLLQRTGSRAHRLQWLQHVGSIAAALGPKSSGSIVMVHKFSCSTTWGIFPDLGSNPCLLHWQADSLPLSHQENSGNNSLILLVPLVHCHGQTSFMNSYLWFVSFHPGILLHTLSLFIAFRMLS